MADKRDKGGGKPEESGVDVGKVIRIDEQRIKSHKVKRGQVMNYESRNLFHPSKTSQ